MVVSSEKRPLNWFEMNNERATQLKLKLMEIEIQMWF